MSSSVAIQAGDNILFGYTSLVTGHNSDDPTVLQLATPFHDVLVQKYGNRAPRCTNQGVIGQQLATYTGTAFGGPNPDIVVIDGLPNDIGVAQATIDAWWTKATTVGTYPRAKLPRAVIWISTIWRGSEIPGGTNQAQIQIDNTLAAARTAANNANFTAGTVYCDAWSLWQQRALIDNPTNKASGVYTADGTHFLLKGAQLVRDALLQVVTLT